ncbi:MAG: 50S ribosomal protein L3 [Phycisphaerales bacterium]|nr:50S ribosomal protein L3 [Phycisphaerales bacterium]
MNTALIGRKVGMTRWFLEDGTNIPVTVIAAGPCAVTQVKTTENAGYAAVQIAYEDVKPRSSTMQVIGHDAKAGVSPKRVHREIRLPDDAAAAAFSLGQTIDVSSFEKIKFVDVIGTSKGKGFTGAMKAFRFKGLCASHGVERKHRSPGSIGSHGTDRGHGAKIKKGKKMPGRTGAERVTSRSLDVVSIDLEKNILIVKGAVPGANSGILFVRPSIRLFKPKARLQAKA